MSYSNQPYRPGGFQVIPPAIKAIILINVGVFLLESFPAFGNVLLSEFALWPLGSGNFRIWQPLTYLFLHGGTAHIFFNMFALWIFGAEIENHWGTKQFNIYYFTCGIGAALINLIATMGSLSPTIGASGAVYGILLAFGMMFPDRYIFLYFLFPIKAKFFVAGYAFIEFFSGLGSRTMGSGSNVAHFAHLGGMLIGWIYITLKRRDISISDMLGKVLPRKKRGGAKIHSIRRDDEMVTEAEIDRILEKISHSGYSSLSADERHKLLKAGRK
ncbi:MAG: rhomboid family intramembrane serine protease [Pelodictyon luteolum]|uniref:Rhomboid family intramembrane serine protease n=1 Tax=Pelodictyon luteolum TaxID=1100 RepID=A0A165M835_PELLU|nr:rhomboid family intramembrane serine protease [Pelodictyon luteolum]KZK74923.1 MAG: rhomboid family intramembrane serine protease [Pelodictyon luteolum]